MQTMYPGKVNSPKALTEDIIGASETTIEVSDGSVLPAAPNLAVLGSGENCETILYTVKTENILSGITRGFQGTAQEWPAETPIGRNFTEYDNAAMQANIAEIAARFIASDTVVYVSKQGSDSNAGTRPFSPKLTIGAAMSGLTGGVVKVLDAGTYTEDVTVPNNVSLDAANATIIGAMTVGNGCSVRAAKIMPNANNTTAVTKTGSEISMVDADVWEGRGAAGTLTGTTLAYNSVAGAILYATGRTFNVAEDGWAVKDNASDNGHIHLNADDVYLFGDDSVGAEVQGPNSHIVIIAQHIITPNGITGTTALKSSNSSARIEATTNEITAEVAALANMGEVSLNCPKITGSLTGSGVSVVGRIVGADADLPVFTAANGALATKTASAARSALGAAAAAHAHGSITNDGKIGSVANLPIFTGTAGALDVKSAADAKIALNIAPHNYLYAGRDLSTIFTAAQLHAAVSAGDFSNIRIGDYWPITLTGTYYDYAESANKTLSSAVVNLEVAGIDTYLQYGDTAVPHHLVMISRDCLPNTMKMRSADTTWYNTSATNPWLGSAAYETFNNTTNGILALVAATALGAYIYAGANDKGMRFLGETKAAEATAATSWGWLDRGKLWLPTEREVWGQDVWSEHIWGGGVPIQTPIFAGSLRHIIKGLGDGGSRCDWWCSSSSTGSDAIFCLVSASGLASYGGAGSAYGVPLCFLLA